MQEKASMHTNGGTYGLLISVIMTWGLCWPTSKMGLFDISPLWFSALRLIIGSGLMFAILFLSKKFTLPKRQDLPLILSVGLLQMGLFLMLLNLGLLHVDAGRSAILVYTTPLWVTPVAIFVFGEKLTRLKSLGLILGLGGIITLFSPWGIDWSNRNIIFGNLMLILAAISWACTLLHVRYAKWHSTPFQLIPWQLLTGAIPVTIIAAIYEPTTQIHWTNSSTFCLLFNALLGTAFAYWGVIVTGKRLSVINISLCLLGVPVVGLLSSNLLLGEPLTANILTSMLLILGGLACVALGSKKTTEGIVTKATANKEKLEENIAKA